MLCIKIWCSRNSDWGHNVNHFISYLLDSAHLADWLFSKKFHALDLQWTSSIDFSGLQHGSECKLNFSKIKSNWSPHYQFFQRRILTDHPSRVTQTYISMPSTMPIQTGQRRSDTTQTCQPRHTKALPAARVVPQLGNLRGQSSLWTNVFFWVSAPWLSFRLPRRQKDFGPINVPG